MEKKEYKPLTIPHLQWDKKSLTETTGELVVQPLEPGFGVTIGNALRRVLLGAVEGSAVTSVVIKGVNNEFSTITGVIEDVMHLVLNIKGIVVKNTEGQSGKMRLHVVGEAVVRAGDVKSDPHLEIVNPDHVLAHVALDGELEIEFFVESGRGYREAQWPTDKALQDDNRIYLDAMLSPVRNVTLDVEKTRVGGDIDYDKLTLHIQTDGSEDPLSVLHYAVSVLRSQLEHFLKSVEIPFNVISAEPEHDQEAIDVAAGGDVTELPALKGISVDLLMKPIDELELSVRAHNCLINAGIKRVLDLVNLGGDEVLKIKNLGKKSLKELEESMKAFGLSFGMNIREEDLKQIIKYEKAEK